MADEATVAGAFVTALPAFDVGRVVILGAGPTGLGVAHRLQQLGHRDHVLLERATVPGGLAASVVDERGFTWDVGGHVQFSHYTAYDRVLDQAVDRWLTHEREAWVWFRDRFVPYPFQNNLHRLDPADRERAVRGLEVAISRRDATRPPRTFAEWIDSTYGEGIASLFMRDYNAKVWGYPLDEIGVGWMDDRVALPSLDRIRRSAVHQEADVPWGPNRTFRFPLEGGTGAIWAGVAGMLPSHTVDYGALVVGVDHVAHRVQLADGRHLDYNILVSTIPLDRLCGFLAPLPSQVHHAASRLRHSAVHIVGIGLRQPQPETLSRKCWIYFPDPASPFYRVTVFSNYSPRNVPGEEYWSLMAEVCESPTKPVDNGVIVAEVIAALGRDGLLPRDASIASRWHRREEYGYPTPFIGRDEVLGTIRRELESHRIFSRGRFGAWKYEVSNQDHSFMQGVELVDRLVLGIPEVTIDEPARANSGVFLEADASD